MIHSFWVTWPTTMLWFGASGSCWFMANTFLSEFIEQIEEAAAVRDVEE